MISAQTYALVQDSLQADSAGCLLMEEYDDHQPVENHKGGGQPDRATPEFGKRQCRQCRDAVSQGHLGIDQNTFVVSGHAEIDDQDPQYSKP